MNARLVAESVGKRFGSRVVLNAASFWAREGEVTTLMGRNGSGKTTLMRIACGWLRPDFGTVRWNGRVLPRPQLHRLAREGLFFVPDRGVLASAYTVGDNLNAVWERFAAGMTVEEAAERMGVGHVLESYPPELSGGERRKASLAAALVRNPTCLVVDEPYAGIAPRDVPAVTSCLRGLASEGTAVVASGHDVRALLEVSDRIVWVVAGTTHLLGPPEQARAHRQFQREYLGPGAGGVGVEPEPA